MKRRHNFRAFVRNNPTIQQKVLSLLRNVYDFNICLPNQDLLLVHLKTNESLLSLKNLTNTY